MNPADSEELLSRARTCRRIAAEMGHDPLAAKLIEIAEGYEEAARELQPRSEPPLT